MQALFCLKAKAQAKLWGNCAITNIERSQQGESHWQIKRLKKNTNKQGRIIDTIMTARNANTEIQDIIFYLRRAANSGEKVQQLCRKHLVKSQPLESDTHGLLFPSCVPLNKLLNSSEFYFSPCVKEAG